MNRFMRQNATGSRKYGPDLRGRPMGLQAFCGRCGTPLYSTTPGDGVQPSYTVRVGMLRQRDQLIPKKQIWWRSARPWVTALDAVPKIEKQA